MSILRFKTQCRIYFNPFCGDRRCLPGNTKWATVFQREGFRCFFFAGELDLPPDCSYLAEEAHFTHPDIKYIYNNCFGVHKRGRHVTQKIMAIKRKLKDDLYKFIEKFAIELLVPENALTIPLNIPLGLAITEVISETEIPTIALPSPPTVHTARDHQLFR